MYLIDGNSTNQPFGEYKEWRVLNNRNDNELVCVFYGPCALMAASLLCDHLNNDNFIQPGTDGWVKRVQSRKIS